MGNLLPAHKTFIERPVEPGLCLRKYYIRALEIVLILVGWMICGRNM